MKRLTKQNISDILTVINWTIEDSSDSYELLSYRRGNVTLPTNWRDKDCPIEVMDESLAVSTTNRILKDSYKKTYYSEEEEVFINTFPNTTKSVKGKFSKGEELTDDDLRLISERSKKHNFVTKTKKERVVSIDSNHIDNILYSKDTILRNEEGGKSPERNIQD